MLLSADKIEGILSIVHEKPKENWVNEINEFLKPIVVENTGLDDGVPPPPPFGGDMSPPPPPPVGGDMAPPPPPFGLNTGGPVVETKDILAFKIKEVLEQLNTLSQTQKDNLKAILDDLNFSLEKEAKDYAKKQQMGKLVVKGPDEVAMWHLGFIGHVHALNHRNKKRGDEEIEETYDRERLEAGIESCVAKLQELSAFDKMDELISYISKRSKNANGTQDVFDFIEKNRKFAFNELVQQHEMKSIENDPSIKQKLASVKKLKAECDKTIKVFTTAKEQGTLGPEPKKHVSYLSLMKLKKVVDEINSALKKSEKRQKLFLTELNKKQEEQSKNINATKQIFDFNTEEQSRIALGLNAKDLSTVKREKLGAQLIIIGPAVEEAKQAFERATNAEKLAKAEDQKMLELTLDRKYFQKIAEYEADQQNTHKKNKRQHPRETFLEEFKQAYIAVLGEATWDEKRYADFTDIQDRLHEIHNEGEIELEAHRKEVIEQLNLAGDQKERETIEAQRDISEAEIRNEISLKIKAVVEDAKIKQGFDGQFRFIKQLMAENSVNNPSKYKSAYFLERKLKSFKKETLANHIYASEVQDLNFNVLPKVKVEGGKAKKKKDVAKKSFLGLKVKEARTGKTPPVCVSDVTINKVSISEEELHLNLNPPQPEGNESKPLPKKYEVFANLDPFNQEQIENIVTYFGVKFEDGFKPERFDKNNKEHMYELAAALKTKLTNTQADASDILLIACGMVGRNQQLAKEGIMVDYENVNGDDFFKIKAAVVDLNEPEKGRKELEIGKRLSEVEIQGDIKILIKQAKAEHELLVKDLQAKLIQIEGLYKQLKTEALQKAHDQVIQQLNGDFPKESYQMAMLGEISKLGAKIYEDGARDHLIQSFAQTIKNQNAIEPLVKSIDAELEKIQQDILIEPKAVQDLDAIHKVEDAKAKELLEIRAELKKPFGMEPEAEEAEGLKLYLDKTVEEIYQARHKGEVGPDESLRQNVAEKQRQIEELQRQLKESRQVGPGAGGDNKPSDEQLKKTLEQTQKEAEQLAAELEALKKLREAEVKKGPQGGAPQARYISPKEAYDKNRNLDDYFEQAARNGVEQLDASSVKAELKKGMPFSQLKLIAGKCATYNQSHASKKTIGKKF